MKVWFGTTTSDFEKYQENYFGIRNYLKESGCVILFDWLDDVDKAIQKSKTAEERKRDIKNIYKQVTSAIDEADISVIEYTVPNFSTSHQITYSLLKKKPTLVLRLNKDNKNFIGSYMEAIESPLLKVKDYDLQNYQKIIDEFIGFSKIENGPARYNIVLDKKQKYYLDWASIKYKKSRSEIIRGLIDEKVDNDSTYKKYLNI
jgi:hypothetical protein